MYKYPKALVDYLTERESEGSEIFTTQCEDGTMWIIKTNGLENWYILISWYEGDRDYNMVNLCGKSVSRLRRVFDEDGVK